jgi:hypothetical protein
MGLWDDLGPNIGSISMASAPSTKKNITTPNNLNL